VIHRLIAFLNDARLLVGVFLLVLATSGCSILVPQTTELRKARPAGLPDSAELTNVPFVAQEDFNCGPSALAMSIGTVKTGVTLDELVSQVFLPGRQGSLQVEMLAAPRRHGLVSYQLAPRMADAFREVAAGNPVIVLLDHGVWPVSIWHYAVLVGYDIPKSLVTVRTGRRPRQSTPFSLFEYLWSESNYWSMVVMPPDKLPATANEANYLTAIAALERTGNKLAARDAYQAFTGRWPDNVNGLLALANTHHALGELKPAIFALRRAESRQPDSVLVLNNLAQTLADLNRPREAIQAIERAVDLGGPFAAEVVKTRDDIRKLLKKPSKSRQCERDMAPVK
jgi:hypothetical protein